MNTGNNEIGDRLIHLRKSRLLLQKELAKIINVDPSKISRHELGKLDLSSDDLIRYCNFYDVSADYILGIEKQNDRLTKSFNAYKLVNLSDDEIDELDSFVDFIIYKRIRK